MLATIAPLPHPIVRWPLLCAAALVLTIAAPHLGVAGAESDPDVAPTAPGCVGCHHGDVEPAPEGGPAAAARKVKQPEGVADPRVSFETLRAIATLGLTAR